LEGTYPNIAAGHLQQYDPQSLGRSASSKTIEHFICISTLAAIDAADQAQASQGGIRLNNYQMAIGEIG
jgi:hypothetical protein